MGKRILAVVLGLQLAGCGIVGPAPGDEPLSWDTTFDRVLWRAERGDAESQNAAGYMLFLGEGVAPDRARARLWFARAAAAGSDRAKRNLEYVMAPAPGGSRGPRALAPFEDPRRARAAMQFARYCGGCHGLRGIAAYENSPSFAFGERLERSDEALMATVLEGRQEMPGWDGKLPREDLRAILEYARTLPARYARGLADSPEAASSYVYLFGPMEERFGAGMR